MNNVIDFIIEYWYIGLGLSALVLTVLKRIRDAKREDMINWLIRMCRVSEIKINQDERKLKALYDLFCKWYPWTSKIISYKKFKSMVEESLEILEEQLNR